MADEIHQVLVLSTAHVTKATAARIDDLTYECAFQRSDGWVFHVGDQRTDGPDDLEEALSYARARNCIWLMFDADGPINPALPTWEW